MATDDANDPEDQTRSSRRCEKCDTDMRQLGELPALSIHAAIRIFRCYGCDHVVAERT
jgi:hypothetical protein